MNARQIVEKTGLGMKVVDNAMTKSIQRRKLFRRSAVSGRLNKFRMSDLGSRMSDVGF